MLSKIEISISSDAAGFFEIVHNHQISQHRVNCVAQLLAPMQSGKNILSVRSLSGQQLHVDQIALFGVGHEKLVYRGQVQLDNQQYTSQLVPVGGVWTFEYQNPVFVWLHRVLDHGWLLPE